MQERANFTQGNAMGIPDFDYTAQQVTDIQIFLELYCRYEHYPELKVLLNTLRGIDVFGSGTKFISKHPPLKSL